MKEGRKRSDQWVERKEGRDRRSHEAYDRVMEVVIGRRDGTARE